MKIKFLKSSASRVGVWSACVAFALFTAVSFTSCSDDDDDNGGGGSDEGGLVDSTLPSEGWSGSELNGVLTYVPEADEPSYFAFKFENGICKNAVYNFVCESDAEARYMYSVLKDGTWVDLIDDDESDYYAESVRTAGVADASLKNAPLFSASKVVEVAGKFAGATRAGDFLAKYDVSRDGKVVYVNIDCLKGKTSAQVKYVANAWVKGFENEVPSSFLFGTWNEASGTYTCTDLYGIGAKYEVKVSTANGFVTKYVTTLTMPSDSWAVLIERSMEESVDGYEQIFGASPTIVREGNKVSLNAIIIGQVSTETVMDILYVIDYMNNIPFLYSMFG